ncbi:NAD(P)-binding domain-containing protein [Candidatus Woesearchaeota archaeon]|nr:NAD(P)-binding domain-containing protein [Candidatus Woesearchaeota archaeon]
MKENIPYLESWFYDLQRSIKELKGIAIDKNIKLLFSISTTTCKHGTNKPYTTPVRFLENSLISGVVVFSKIQSIVVTNIVKDFVDDFLIDVEQKHNMKAAINSDTLKYFQDKYFINGDIKCESILSIVRAIVADDRIIEYKANDITVDAIWTFLSTKLNYLSGKKVAIIGCGNIGSKLALKLVESDANVVLVRRDSSKGKLIANAINLIKPPLSKSYASYNSSAIEASKFCDVIIGAANTNNPVITWDMIKNLSKNGFVVDIGKGNIEADAIKKSIEKKIDIIRGDIAAALYGFVSQKQQMQEIVQNKIGRVNIDSDINIVSGGVLGRCGDIVVDSFASPSLVYGVANGSGSIKTDLNLIDKKNIEKVKKIINKSRDNA